MPFTRQALVDALVSLRPALAADRLFAGDANEFIEACARYEGAGLPGLAVEFGLFGYPSDHYALMRLGRLLYGTPVPLSARDLPRTGVRDERGCPVVFHHGDVALAGNLDLAATPYVVVTGNLTVHGVVEGLGPAGATLVVGGNLAARGMDVRGDLVVGGDLRLRDALAVRPGPRLPVVGGAVSTRVYLAPGADAVRGLSVLDTDHAWLGPDAEAACEPEARRVLSDDVFAPVPGDPREIMGRYRWPQRLFRLLGRGVPVFR